MGKRNKEFAFECVDKVVGEIINSNDKFTFEKNMYERLRDYGSHGDLAKIDEGLYEITYIR